jgi:N-acetyl-1-D-myo-inositol-2-amino-2-deoxy-alpha-D-glucopyranoside deacetylase
MVVVAHPDDDAYGVAGSVALHGDDPRFRYVLVHATFGEAGEIPEGFPATRATLGQVRRAEDERAWRAHGREPDRHEWLGLPDGGVPDVPRDELEGTIEAIMEQERPDVVATFGPDGITGHPDHIAVGAATDAVFGRLARDGGPGLRRLVHGALPETVFRRFNGHREAEGLPPWDPTAVYHLRGVPDELIGITVDTSAVTDRVRRAFLEHRSQLHVAAPRADDDRGWHRALAREHLVIVWPPREPGAPRLGDLFEGLDG